MHVCSACLCIPRVVQRASLLHSLWAAMLTLFESVAYQHVPLFQIVRRHCWHVGQLDQLVCDIISLLDNYVQKLNSKLKRNEGEVSLASSAKRPDLCVLVRGALLLKGKDKTTPHSSLRTTLQCALCASPRTTLAAPRRCALCVPPRSLRQ